MITIETLKSYLGVSDIWPDEVHISLTADKFSEQKQYFLDISSAALSEIGEYCFYIEYAKTKFFFKLKKHQKPDYIKDYNEAKKIVEDNDLWDQFRLSKENSTEEQILFAVNNGMAFKDLKEKKIIITVKSEYTGKEEQIPGSVMKGYSWLDFFSYDFIKPGTITDLETMTTKNVTDLLDQLFIKDNAVHNA